MVNYWDRLLLELIKAIPTAIIAAVGALLAIVVGKQISEYWEIRKKRRELELATLNDFYRQYGEFFAVWKLWNQHVTAPRPVKNDVAWKLLERASAIEAGIEATLVKITTERRITRESIDNMGLLRQAFRRLRISMKNDEELDWRYSEHEEYVAFKRLACTLTTLLLTSSDDQRPTVEEATNALRQITANIPHETRWQEIRDKEKAKHPAMPIV
jgi:hypothetical protein